MLLERSCRRLFFPCLIVFCAFTGNAAEATTPWSYPPRAWPCWEILRARANVYGCGLYVGYPARLADAWTSAVFRGPDGREFCVSASSCGGVPCVRGVGYEARVAREWVKCDVFRGTEDCPPHRIAFPGVKGVPTYGNGLYELPGEVVAYVYCRSSKRPKLTVGESRAEALNDDPQWVEQCCWMEPTGVSNEWRTVASLAFRYYRFDEKVEDTWFVRDELQETPVHAYESDDERLVGIWKSSVNTVRLCSRHFFVDAVKRDRMVWTGDQSVALLADAATFGNSEMAKFSVDALGLALEGGFCDYSVWWVILNGLLWTQYGESDFIAARWNVIRRNTDALGEGLQEKNGLRVPSRKIFIDWGYRGNPTTAYNVLVYGAYSTAAALAEKLGKKEDAGRWNDLSARFGDSIRRHALDRKTGLLRCDAFDDRSEVLRQANILAVLVGLFKGDDAERIAGELAKDDLPGVGTTWMMGLENLALQMTGHSDVVLRRIRCVWGGMNDLGHDVAFEHWWPDARGTDVYRFYGRKFGLSLCHVTSASPAFLLPRIAKGDVSNPFDVRGNCPRPDTPRAPQRPSRP